MTKEGKYVWEWGEQFFLADLGILHLQYMNRQQSGEVIRISPWIRITLVVEVKQEDVEDSFNVNNKDVTFYGCCARLDGKPFDNSPI